MSSALAGDGCRLKGLTSGILLSSLIRSLYILGEELRYLASVAGGTTGNGKGATSLGVVPIAGVTMEDVLGEGLMMGWFSSNTMSFVVIGSGGGGVDKSIPGLVC